MTQLVIDTSGYSLFKRGHTDATASIERFSTILMPSITLGELFTGFTLGNRTTQNRLELDKFLASPRVKIVGTSLISAERYGIISAHLRRNGTPIPTNDIWIAAITMQHGATLLTADKHFENVPQIVTKLLA